MTVVMMFPWVLDVERDGARLLHVSRRYRLRRFV
jgi:hypothetical protein